ncbi:hypothetical protein D3C71_1185360 [compost metagenome]
MAAATGWVAYLNRQKRGTGLFGVGPESLFDHWQQRGLNQFLHQVIRSVVGAASLASVALITLALSIADKAKAPRRCSRVDTRFKLQQRLINRAQLLGVHVAVVDASGAVLTLHPRHGTDGGKQRFVAKLRGVQINALFRSKKTT